MPPGRQKATTLIERARELAQHYPDDQIAELLNAQGVKTANGLPWTLGRVRGIRGKNKIPSACLYISPGAGPRGDGLIKAAEAAERLGVSFGMVSDWFRRGLLAGSQLEKKAPIWLRLESEDIGRLDGSAALQADMLPLGEAPAALGMTTPEMQVEIRAGRLKTYRLRHGKQWRWYVQLPAPNETHRNDT